jgi:ABC-type transport system involved in multi-copper enzyme maturation permease subunit
MTLLGPVFHKELLELSRRRSTYYLRALAGLGMLFVIMIYATFPNVNDAGLSTTKRQAAIGNVVFEQWMHIQFWLVCGAMPLLVCSLVAGEREAGSLELLFTTHLTDREIVLGKLASRVFVVVLVIFSALPVLVILGLLGGIDFDRLLKIQLLTITAALMIAAAGLYYSTVAKRPWVACLQTYGLFVLLWAFVPFALIAGFQIYMQSQGGGMGGMPPRWLFFSLLASAPWFDVMLLCDLRGRSMAGWLLDWEGVLAFAGTWFAVSAFFLFFTMRELRKGPRKSLVSQLTRLVIRPFEWIARLAFGKRGEAIGTRPWRLRLPNFGLFEGNPIVWRNRRAEVYDPDGHMFRLQLGAWLLAGGMIALFSLAQANGPRTPFFAILVIEIAFLHVMIAAVGASSISRERQRGSFDLLLLSSLTPAAIVFGTVRGVVRICAPIILLVVVTIYAAVLFESFSIDFALRYSAVVSTYTMALVVASVLISTAATHAAHAVITTFAVGLAYWFMPLPVGTVYAAFGFGYRHGVDPRIVKALLIAFAVFVVTMFVVGVYSLRGKRSMIGAGAVAFSIPAMLIHLVPTYGFRGVSMLWRFLSDIDTNYYRASSQSWRSGNEIANLVPWVYGTSAILMAAIAVRMFDRIVGRSFSRPKVQPTANPPFAGLSAPEAGSKAPMPMKVVSETRAASLG